MRVIEEVRRLRLIELAQEHGSYVALNKLLGLLVRDSTLSQYRTTAPNSRTGKPRGMGSALARRLEAAAGKPVGWMDTDPDLAASTWPLERVDRERYLRLAPEDRAYVQGAMNRAITECEAPPLGAPLVTGGAPSGVALHDDTGKRHAA